MDVNLCYRYLTVQIRLNKILFNLNKQVMARYSKKAQEKVEKVMKEYKKGKLKSGHGGKVKNRKQAIAIGLSEARNAGAKVPPPSKKKVK